MTAVAVLATGAAVALPAQAAPPAPLLATYVVTVAPSSAPSAVAPLTAALGGRVGFVYAHALHGFSVTLPTLAEPLLRALPGVVAVQPNQVLHASATQADPPSYGLDRIDQRALPLSHSYTTTSQGAGVTAYVVDTGIRYDHRDFGGRATPGFDAITPGGGAVDCNGHGTHVSGTIGGTAYGVAKAVRLVGVRVLDCSGSGTTAQVVAGLDWVIGNHQAGVPAVANLSLGGSADTALDTAVKNAIADGITFGVAAGNDGGFVTDLLGSSDACNGSPSRVPAALTVAATDASDARASYSNRGSCVDLWAPGSAIVSDWYTSATATQTLNGTSMATPHVVGAAALLLAKGYQSPAAVAVALIAASTKNVVTGAGSGTPNRLLFTNG
ncbi:MAG: S8 family serine peptidase [Mycobacteriales bacterium]